MTPPASTPGEQRRQIEQLRARFEKGWQAGAPPALEDLLAEVHPQTQPELLRELLVLECDHRKRLGRPLTADEARRRFARVGGWLAGVLASLGLDSSSPPAGKLRLEVTAGPCFGRDFELADHSTFLVGRGPTGVHLAIEGDPSMSRLHCLIEYNPPHARVADLRSKNGTFVNGQRVEQADLREGDEIRVGQTALGVRLGGEGRTVTIEGVDANSTLDPAQGRGVGERVPGYTILEELGRGGMGVVYKARRESDGLLVALKTVLPAVPPFAETLARFRREAEILRQLVHPCIVRFHEAGEARGMLYFAMELVEGESAAKLIERRGPLRPDRVLAVGRHLLDALAFAHDRKIVHRDVKPGNILLARREKRVVVKLADFGLARVYQASAMSGLTMAGTPGGTPGFMPPEQVLNFRQARPAADQYAAAATLYYLLTGKAIYPQANNGVDQLLRTLEEEPLPLREPEEGPPLPGRLRDVFRRALARDPDARYPDVRALRDALAKAL